MSLHLFQYKEAIAQNYQSALPNYFKINANTSYDVLVMRLLTSSIHIQNTKHNKDVLLDTSYTEFPQYLVARKSTKQLKEFLAPFSLSKYVLFSQKFYGRNLTFYHNLLQELTYYFYYSHEGQHQAAFINLYRILEYISYSFPLIHASHFGNYSGSFEALRGYFVDAKTSELKFFEKFIENLYRGTNSLSLATDFDFSSADVIVANNCYAVFFSLLRQVDWTNADQQNQALATENKNIIQLFKNVRNRYFHFAIGGQRNIQNTDLKDPDFFFERINPKFLNWIGFIYKTVIQESLDNAFL